MPEYIEREALLKDISESVVFTVRGDKPSLEIRGANKVIDRIKAAPTADVVEVKHGYWEIYEDEYDICASEFVCSNCKESFVTSELTDEEFSQMMKYCLNCGAKMDEEEGAEK